ncbi:MAG TPA: DUF1203 domain-containing protein [Chthoniobacterales bacterium]|nr:DUF1203 domain-containing protein [Chthoniobacterales bacterium]
MTVHDEEEINNAEAIRRPKFVGAPHGEVGYIDRMPTSTFRIVPLPNEIAEAAREAVRLGGRGHTIVEVNSPQAYPCRHCLRWAQPGERVVLFPYASIPAGRPYAESGPIFVHENPCEPYSTTSNYPQDFRKGRVLRAYDSADNMIDAVVVDGEEPEALIAKLFANPEAAFLQIRSVTRGCFTFKIERNPS